MDCRQVQLKIADHSVGLLGAREAELVQSHLAACTACEREWRELQAVVGLVERFGSREPPPHLWNGVYNRITADAVREQPGFWERLFGGPSRWIAGTATGVMAAAALLAALYFTTGHQSDGDRLTPLPIGQPIVAVQQHSILAGADPFADVVGLEAYARLVTPSNDSTPQVH